MAILDKNGHCELMGKGWEESNNVYYSNNSYAREPYRWPTRGSWNDDWWDDGYYFGRAKPSKKAYKKVEQQPIGFATSQASKAKADAQEKESRLIPQDSWWQHYNYDTGKYEFDGMDCPGIMDNDSSYCCMCSQRESCALVNPFTKEA